MEYSLRVSDRCVFKGGGTTGASQRTKHRCRIPRPHAHARGFTLVELLVALVAMALMALMGWRGLDSMMRSQQYTQAHTDAHAVMQTALAQWSADLDGLMALDNTQAIAWDGQALRMTRRNAVAPEAGALVVAWTRRTSQGSDQWLRWQSPPVRTRNEWNDAWNQAGLWARNPSAEQRTRETALFPLANWSIYFFRDGAWSNPQSSDASTSAASDAASAAAAAAAAAAASTTGTTTDATTTNTGTMAGTTAASGTAANAIPDGVRIVLELAPGSGLSGRLIRDWVNPLRQNMRS
ncbi:prepilin-type N-terminal cleavage/methylation domain-containing protein [Comamonas antarctica]|uniref:Prepilin-type N-terminal cleavage/methylation domain-containing protein n=1 Tax=Comamonas antarctica TaxID=2743470 RepID=A0A6N1X651_9BURK|nr:prepilin-type N-terminal cleavage/methylation domain-containing protein [Comamonas antarctica]